MADANEFIHLPFPQKEDGRAYYRRILMPQSTKTAQNKQNRQGHGSKLKKSASDLSKFWNTRRTERKQKNLPLIEGGIPFLLQIDPNVDVNFLYGLGFEIVCDLDDGFIVVASEDVNLNIFQEKVDDFISEKQRSGSPANIYGLCADCDRLALILSKSLYEKWAALDETNIYTVDISIECNGMTRNPDLPEKDENESDEDYSKKCQNCVAEYYKKIDDIAMKRQEQFENIVLPYDAVVGSYIENVDSFSVTVSISGEGLRDLVQNYGYIFEVIEAAEVKMESSAADISLIEDGLQFYEPEEGSPIIGVIDSGIQENHRYISPAIISEDSICLVPGETSTNDEYGRNGVTGGHGTRVAGAVLFQNDIPTSGAVLLPYFIRNARILDKDNRLRSDANRGDVLKKVIDAFYLNQTDPTRIYNHSVGEDTPFDGEQLKHMSVWAAKMDDLSYDNDILFIQAAGNIPEDIIKAMIIGLDQPYPEYFSEKPTRLSNPAQSLQAITVGSISHSDYEDDDYIAIGKKGEISSFSRIGPGIWDSIKPDVVEYGGTNIINKGDNSLTTNEDVCSDLIRTSPQGPAHARDGIGTSFSTPKVTYIAGAIQKALPNAPALLYRALIAQSARYPKDISRMTKEQKKMLMRQMGYGLPNVERATHNSKYRATFVTPTIIEIGAGEAHIFPIHIPESLREVGDDYNILVEITLSYAAKPRRTRQGLRGYLSTWVDWICSRIGEDESIFKQRVFETDKSIQDDGSFKWAIREQGNWGDFKDFSRKGQTLQKDWCIIKSNQLNDVFCVAVRGHKGWGSLFRAKYALAISFEAVDQNIELYEKIRLENINVEVNADEVRVEVDDFA